MGKSTEEHCLASPLYSCTVAVQNGHISPELMKIRGRHYKPSMENDVISGAEMILYYTQQLLRCKQSLTQISFAWDMRN